MKNSLKYFFLILVVVICASCAEKEEADTENEPTTFVEGTWKKACSQSSSERYSEYIMVYKNTSRNYYANEYSDSACSTAYRTLRYTYTLAVGSDATMADGSTTATKVTETTVGVFETVITDALVSELNSNSYCGGDWEKDVEKDITSKSTEDTCLDLDDAIGTVYKDVLKIKGTDLWWGVGTSDKDSEGYYTVIEDSGYDKQ